MKPFYEYATAVDNKTNNFIQQSLRVGVFNFYVMFIREECNWAILCCTFYYLPLCLVTWKCQWYVTMTQGKKITRNEVTFHTRSDSVLVVKVEEFCFVQDMV